MKIPSKTYELDTLGYEPGFFVKAPQSVKEGWFNELAKSSRKAAAVKAVDRDPEKDREQNLKIFELVTEWNLTGDDDKTVLPLLSTLKTTKEKLEVMAQIPLDVVLFIVGKVLGVDDIKAKTRDF